MKKKKLLEKTRRKSYNSALERYKNRKRKEIAVLISIVALVITFVIFLNSSFVKVKHINISGLVQIEKNDLIENSGLSSELKMWKINEDDYEKIIKDKYNIVSNVTIEKNWLNTLNIHVQEKKLLVQEKRDDVYVKLLEDGQEYNGKVVHSLNLPILEKFSNYPIEKSEILKSLSELDSKVLYKISEVNFDEQNKNIANVYMRDGQRVKVNLVNFSTKLNHYNEIEKFIENKDSTILNLVNGAYLETRESEQEKTDRVNEFLNSYLENKNPTDVTSTIN